MCPLHIMSFCSVLSCSMCFSLLVMTWIFEYLALPRWLHLPVLESPSLCKFQWGLLGSLHIWLLAFQECFCMRSFHCFSLLYEWYGALYRYAFWTLKTITYIEVEDCSAFGKHPSILLWLCSCILTPHSVSDFWLFCYIPAPAFTIRPASKLPPFVS